MTRTNLSSGRLFPIQGAARVQTHFSPTPIERYPGTQKAMPGSITLFRIDTKFYKDGLATKLAISPVDPGAWHMHKETTQNWCKQMTVEFVDETGKWHCPAGKANHAWDVSVYMMFLADLLRLRDRRKPDPEKQRAQPQKQTVVKSKFVAMLNR